MKKTLFIISLFSIIIFLFPGCSLFPQYRAEWELAGNYVYYPNGETTTINLYNSFGLLIASGVEIYLFKFAHGSHDDGSDADFQGHYHHILNSDGGYENSDSSYYIDVIDFTWYINAEETEQMVTSFTDSIGTNWKIFHDIDNPGSITDQNGQEYIKVLGYN